MAVDVDPAMIAYARQHNNAPTIEYSIQNMATKWAHLSPDIQRLEGSVDLIFANFSFNRIRAKSQLLSICRRLLATGGQIYANIVLISDVNRKAGPNQRRREWCPSPDKQLAEWRQLLRDYGMAVDVFELDRQTYCLTRQEIIVYVTSVVLDYKMYFETDHQFECDKNDLMEILYDLTFNPSTDAPDPKAWTRFLANESVADGIVTRQVLRFVCN
ncbi:unnamed protein product [Medioppia subpectinata]|uniref:Methyltransferase type 11 domain-containing protein n=1 Tax=Medioppia subpectinata TaxID=1979941 RepID=A0A7R9Q4A2_9ACAR|nr:unnamed protein product [Medioppia subpectinata]CAG2112421.1 unnamed protein product [Medioppia subpectinata]